MKLALGLKLLLITGLESRASAVSEEYSGGSQGPAAPSADNPEDALRNCRTAPHALMVRAQLNRLSFIPPDTSRLEELSRILQQKVA